MNTQQLISAIQKLPFTERQKVLASLNYRPQPEATVNADQLEQEVAALLLSRGVISEVPEPMSDREDAEYPLLDIPGRPLSEIILEERR